LFKMLGCTLLHHRQHKAGVAAKLGTCLAESLSCARPWGTKPVWLLLLRRRRSVAVGVSGWMLAEKVASNERAHSAVLESSWVLACLLQGFVNVLNWYLLPPGEQLES
jgi:hypothetical protein